MQVSISKNIVNFRTPFSEKYDLIQKYKGACEGNFPYNNVVDAVETGLMLREKWDFWHIDIPFSISNDEAPALEINSTHIGCNHGQPGGISLYLPSHDKTIADIGSLWKDEDGTVFTLLYADDASVAFVSENIGPSETEYAFKDHVAGTLTHVKDAVHPAPVVPGERRGGKWIEPVTRFMKRQILAYKDGKAALVSGFAECDYAEIHEEYEIVNPASMVRALHENRPEGGYMAFPPAMGDAMMHCLYIYRIDGDGTVTVDFTYEKKQDVMVGALMGAMYQERLDTFRGGIFRYIPKILPFDTPEGTFDFSMPTPTAPGKFPKAEKVTPDRWANPASPPDKIADIFCDEEGHDRLGFVCGYLPVYDGLPEKRTPFLHAAMYIVRTRKAYPFFVDKNPSRIHGIAYKKYFVPQADGVFMYTIPHDGKKYIYMDIFKETTLSVPFENSMTLYEKSDSVSFEIKNNILTVCGTKGYAVFITE